MLPSIPLLERKPKGGTYRITVSGLGSYYGESDDIERRWRKHRNLLRAGRHHNMRLQRAWSELGPRAFAFERVECTDELSRSKALRMVAEAALIRADPLCLNVSGAEHRAAGPSLPDREAYRRRTLWLDRVGRSQLAVVREREGGAVIGREYVDGKWRRGPYVSDERCALRRVSR